MTMNLVCRPVLCLVALMTGAPWTAAAPEPEASLVTRFLNKAVSTPTSYRASRRLEARNPRFRISGWIEAVTELNDGRFSYSVTARGGSGFIQNRVLIPALEAERELRQEGYDALAISTSNYRLEAAPADELGFQRIRLIPLRADRRLLDGYLLLTDEADVVEVSGRLAKAPSFWTTAVTFTRRYGHMGEMRVPLSVTSVANVRLAGRSTFSMTYDFDVIDGVPVAGQELDRHGQPGRGAESACEADVPAAIRSASLAGLFVRSVE
jgi:hypothetical protein